MQPVSGRSTPQTPNPCRRFSESDVHAAGSFQQDAVSRSGTDPSLRRQSSAMHSDNSGDLLMEVQIPLNPHPSPELTSSPVIDLGSRPPAHQDGPKPAIAGGTKLSQTQQKLLMALSQVESTDQEAARQLASLIDKLGNSGASASSDSSGGHEKILSVFEDGEATQEESNDALAELNRQHVNEAKALLQKQREELGGLTAPASAGAVVPPAAVPAAQVLERSPQILQPQATLPMPSPGPLHATMASPDVPCPALLSPCFTHATHSEITPGNVGRGVAPNVDIPPLPLPPRVAGGRGDGVHIEPQATLPVATEVSPHQPPLVPSVPPSTLHSAPGSSFGLGVSPVLPLAQPLTMQPPADPLSYLQTRHQHEQQELLMQQQQELRQLENPMLPMVNAIDGYGFQPTLMPVLDPGMLQVQPNIPVQPVPLEGQLQLYPTVPTHVAVPAVPTQEVPVTRAVAVSPILPASSTVPLSPSLVPTNQMAHSPVFDQHVPTPAWSQQSRKPMQKKQPRQPPAQGAPPKQQSKVGRSAIPKAGTTRHTEILQLIEVTKSILLDPSANKFLGSLPAVVVQRLVHERDPDRYNQVIDTYYDKSFHSFVKAHDEFRMFYYDKEVIQCRSLLHCSPDEGRITFSEISNTILVERDRQTAEWKGQLWEQALQTIEQMIRKQPLQMRSLISRFRDQDEDMVFEGVLPSNHAFRQLLRRHQDRLIITHDALVKVPEQLDEAERQEWERKQVTARDRQKPQPKPVGGEKATHGVVQPKQPVDEDGPRRSKARGRRERRARAKSDNASDIEVEHAGEV